MTAREVYDGSDALATKNFCGGLIFCGSLGLIAINLFRAQKASARAKVYRGGIPGKGSYRSLAYEKKEWSMGMLCEVLQRNAEANKITWGWKVDPNVPFGDAPSHVLYVDLPNVGQVSFHSPKRGLGPEYPGEWDQQHASADRIIQFCDGLLVNQEQELFS